MNINTIIIGAGPAGIAAAIQLRRAGHDFLLLEKGPIGGLLLNANLVENYPGFTTGISGPDLVRRFREHLSSLDIAVTQDLVTKADFIGNQFVIETGRANHTCNNLIVASGTKARKIDKKTLPCNVDKIYYEIHEIRHVMGKTIAIIGGGDAAFDYAINLSKDNDVHLIWRSKHQACLPLLYKRASNTPSIKMYPEFPHLSSLQADYVVAAIGREPNTDFLSPKIKNHFLESIPLKGLYFAGDVARGQYRQVAIAIGDGIQVAMDIVATYA